MSLDLTTLKNWITETEADVLQLVADIKQGIAVVESDISAALNWIAANAPTIAADIQQVLGIVETIGLGANPDVAAAVIAANEAVSALNAFAAAKNSGQTDTQSVLAGYTAVKQAQAAVASATAAAVVAPVPPTA